MKNLKLTIEYDGTNYSGFQRQSNGYTVQEELEKAITKVVSHNIILYCAGRTDAGVHANCQVCNFFTSSKISENGLNIALNSLLPMDISCYEVCEVYETFNARYSAKSRRYQYFILNREPKSAIKGRYAWHVRKQLDLNEMQKAISAFIGTQDFRAFSHAKKDEITIRNVISMTISKKEDMIVIDISANSFLRSMVRNIVGTLVEVGMGKRAAETIQEIIDSKDRRKAGICAPAKGLFLKSVEY